MTSPTHNLNFNDTALTVLKERYLHTDPLTGVQETPEDMLRRVAKCVSKGDKDLEDKFFTMMAELKFLPNSPTLMNAGHTGKQGQLSACFVLPVEDDMEGIFESLKHQAIIHKSGGGTGFNFSKLRAKGSKVGTTNGIASGPVSFMKLFDAATSTVMQGGCFTGDTLIATAEGAVKISELKEGMLVYSHHPKDGFVLRPCTDPFLTKHSVEVMELETDKGLKVRATPNHPFMLRCKKTPAANEFRKLEDLTEGTPLMPLTTYNKKGYRYITLHDGSDTRRLLHRWLAAQAGKHGSCIHHINGDKTDNRLSNLTNEMAQREHAGHHSKERIEDGTHAFLHLTKEQQLKAGEGYSKWYASLSEAEKQSLKAKNSEALKKENKRRYAVGSHNFIGDKHPSKDPTVRLKQRKGRLANTIWTLRTAGYNPTADTIEAYSKEAGLYNTQRFTLSSYEETFGSFEAALAYADARNCKVKQVTRVDGKFDVWNVEVPVTHNYVVCNEDCTQGVVVSNSRRGANMGLLNIDHPDISEFINCKNKNDGTLSNFNISVGVTDEFMEKLTDPELEDDPEVIEIWNNIVNNAWKNGDPGLIFLDNLEEANPTPKLGRLDTTNPCVTGDTPILTDRGYIPIAKAVDREVNIWNGVRYSKVTPRITGENQKILTFVFSDGSEIKCTPYHKFLIQRGFTKGGTVERVEARELKVGDKLVKCSYPVIASGTDTMTTDEAYLNGFFTGDGTTNKRGKRLLYLYDKKRALLSFFTQLSDTVREYKTRDVIRLSDDAELRNKYWIPATETMENRLAWLAGLIDSDGNRNSKDGSVSIASINREFLLEVRLMLNTLDVSGSVLPLKDECEKLMHDDNGDKKAYHCKKSYRLTIAASDVAYLIFLGLNTKRVDLSNTPLRRAVKRFIKVLAIKDEGLIADKVYCFTEPHNHTGIFNGLLLGNCGEQPLLPYESCNLGSINLSKFVTYEGGIDYTSLESTVRLAVRFLDNVIDVNHYPLPEIEKATKLTRKIGLGVMGFADVLFNIGIPYSHYRARVLADTIMVFIKQTAKDESYAIARTEGSAPCYGKTNICPRNTSLTCIAPTGTISLLAGCSSGIEPHFALAYIRKAFDGTILRMINEEYQKALDDLTDNRIAHGVFETAHNISPLDHIAMQAAFQNHTDAAVSKTVNLPHDATVDDVSEAYIVAWGIGCKGVTVYRDGSKDSQVLVSTSKDSESQPLEKKECFT